MSSKVSQNISCIKFNSYKAFYKKEYPYCMKFDNAVGLIIGKNSSGKSSLIDVIETSFRLNQIMDNNCYIASTYEDLYGLCIGFILDKKHLKQVFKENIIESPYGRLDLYSDRYLGYTLNALIMGNSAKALSLTKDGEIVDVRNCKLKLYWSHVADIYYKEIRKVKFLRLNAERDVVPEMETENSLALQSNGVGATNIIRIFINREWLEEAIVEKTILNELNKIMEPDAHYSGIRVQQIKDKSIPLEDEYMWEIFLEEDGDRFALSKSGSGLKTIILVLINLYLVPTMDGYEDSEIVYAFEELENNLHPALQRRLFEYLYRYSIKNNVKIFLTSHSAVAINTLYEKKDTCIYHVIKSESSSDFEIVSQGYKVRSAISDLGVKASDLFQANGIIWVEGPSDRIYINKWLEIIGDCSFVEGKDYQFMYYGGRLLAHYTVTEFDCDWDKELINILTLNRNTILVMDSDKDCEESTINAIKIRIKQELEEKGFLCWITEGREIENYISAEVINATYNSTLDQIGKFEFFPDYIKEYDKTYAHYKVRGAHEISAHITKNNYGTGTDLELKINTIIDHIKQWNYINKE